MNEHDDGGLAFPARTVTYTKPPCAPEYTLHGGMSLRDYACIELRVPETGKPWLDEIIRKAQADWFAAMAMQGMVAGERDATTPDHRIAIWSYQMADVMLAERRRKDVENGDDTDAQS